MSFERSTACASYGQAKRVTTRLIHRSNSDVHRELEKTVSILC